MTKQTTPTRTADNGKPSPDHAISASDRIRENYEASYAGGDVSEWRMIGAVGKAKNLVRLCSSLPHASLVDIGAGDGALLARLEDLKFGETYTAAELSSTAVETLQKRSIGRLSRVVHIDGYRLPFADNEFDLAVLSHVVEHVEHPRILIREAARIATHLFVEVPLEDTWRLPDDFAFDEVGHINDFSPRTIRRLLQSCDLDIINTCIANPPKAAYAYQKGARGLLNYAIKEVLLRVAPGIATSLLTYHGAMVCKKSGSGID